MKLKGMEDSVHAVADGLTRLKSSASGSTSPTACTPHIAFRGYQ